MMGSSQFAAWRMTWRRKLAGSWRQIIRTRSGLRKCVAKEVMCRHRSLSKAVAPLSIKPLNLLDVMRGKLRQHVAVSRVDFCHRRGAFFDNADVGLVAIS